MVVYLLTAALLPLAVATWVISRQSEDALEAAVRLNLQLVARMTASRLDQLVIDTFRSLNQISRDDSIVALCEQGGEAGREITAAATRRLEVAVAANPDYSALFVIDQFGLGLTGSYERLADRDYFFRDYFQQAMRGQSYVSEIAMGRATRVPAVYFAVPVRHGDDESEPVIGVLVLKFNGERIWALIDQVKVGRSGYAMLSDGKGLVIGHPRRDLLYRRFAPPGPEDGGISEQAARYGVARIESLNLPELLEPMTDRSTAGSLVVRLPEPGDSRRQQPWVIGYAQMRERDWKVAVVVPESQFARPAAELIRQQALVVLVVAIGACVLAIRRARLIVRPIVEIKDAADRLAKGDFSARAEVEGDDELGKLAGAFNAMVSQLRERMSLRNSMELATQVQRSLLPAHEPCDPRLEIVGRSRYCDGTGGDYYDFVETAGGLLIVVGDVMGHGIAAALLMALARGSLRASVERQRDLGELMGCVNAVLCATGERRRFMTLALVQVDSAAGVVRWASAGHDPPVLYVLAEDRFELLEGGDVPMGIDPATCYQQHRREGLCAGDVIVIGTDGVWETRNAQGQCFGRDRVREVIRLRRKSTAREIADAMEKELAAFRGDEPQEDDVTFVIVRLR